MSSPHPQSASSGAGEWSRVRSKPWHQQRKRAPPQQESRTKKQNKQTTQKATNLSTNRSAIMKPRTFNVCWVRSSSSAGLFVFVWDHRRRSPRNTTPLLSLSIREQGTSASVLLHRRWSGRLASPSTRVYCRLCAAKHNCSVANLLLARGAP